MPDPGDDPSTDDLLAGLARWAAGQRVTEAAVSRARARSLLDQLAAGATWEGILLDLAEQAATVEMIVGGGRLKGRLVGVGPDFAVLDGPSGRPVLVRTSVVTGVTGLPGGPPGRPTGARRPALEVGFVDALEALAADNAPVRVHTAGPVVDGDMVALGEDVLTLREPSGARRMVHLRLDAVAACELR